MKLWAEIQIQLCLSWNEMAYSSQKTFDVANYFSYYFNGKVGKLRQEMPTMNSESSYSYIKKSNYERKALLLSFVKLVRESVTNLLALTI